jgi:hypothetical protein
MILGWLSLYGLTEKLFIDVSHEVESLVGIVPDPEFYDPDPCHNITDPKH